MSIHERPIAFQCEEETLIGVLSLPPTETRASDIAMLIVVGGPQYRVGSHRQFVQLARAVAGAGHVVLRFDVRGMGDSSGQLRTFEQLDDDIAAGLRTLRSQAPHARRLILMGLCDGASSSLMYLDGATNHGVSALCLLNPWLRSTETLARTHVKHYYWQRLASADFWRKLVLGGVGLSAAVSFAKALWAVVSQGQRPSQRVPDDFRSRMLRGLQTFRGPVLLTLCETDLTACEFADATHRSEAWSAALGRPGIERVDMADADHTLSSIDAQCRYEAHVLSWMARMSPSQHS